MTTKEMMRMKIKTVALWAAAAALGACAAACGEAPKTTPANANANANAPAAGRNDTVKVQPKVVRDEDGPDDSHITVRQLENGDQVAVRKWKGGPIAKVSRRTKDGQSKAIRVVYKNGKIVKVEDAAAIEHALEWTAAQIDEVAKKSGKVVDEPSAASQKAGGDDDDE
jgi:hypothetical protein